MAVLLSVLVAVVLLNVPALTDAICPCKNGAPQMNNLGLPVFCGRGSASAKCKDGYECTIDPADRYAVCCPLAPCPFGQVWTTCGSACTATCRNPTPECIKMCVPRCECMPEYPILHKGRCIKLEDCPQRLQPFQGELPMP
ncbi:hypothetical protein NP493_316g02022 [Ridgeia piscesae]|uniref:TIL domain-containing protein n=1 Tax=Ridgeia piscesae TaxID=27915 RepID=A0AAD9L5J7_RIDPI|nr:hypothetical protein NP493_316g02022 [Ridgeia piscesae]